MIRIEEISKSFADKRVLSGFTADIPIEGYTVLWGPSGVGKTTLLRILCGLESADSGRVTGVSERAGVVFQEPRLFSHLSALDNVALVCGRERAAELLSAVGLRDDLDKLPGELSGGMAQRVAIARAMGYGSDFLLLDEPFKGLDEDCKKQVMEYVRENSRGGILVTHSPEEAEFFGGRVISI